jgi:WD40 repeat protein
MLCKDIKCLVRFADCGFASQMQGLDYNGKSNNPQAESNTIPIGPLTQKIQELIWFLNFHVLSESPAGLNPKNTLLFCPANNTLRKMLLPKGFPWLDNALILTKPSVESLDNSPHIRYVHRDFVRCCAYSPDGRLIVSGCDDYKVWIRDAETGLVQNVFDAFGNYVYRVVLSGAGAGLIAASSYSKIVLWDVTTARQQKELILETLNKEVFEETGETGEQEPPPILDIALSTAGDKLAAAAGDTVRVWDIPSYKMIELPIKSGNELVGELVQCVRFSSGSEGLLAWTKGKNINVWNLPNGDMHGILEGHEAGIDGLAFSPNGKLLASASDDFTVRIWNVDTSEQLRVLSDHTSYAVSVSFSPDGERLASASYDHTIRIQDITLPVQKDSNEYPLKPAQVLIGHNDTVASVSFPPRGRHVLSSSHDSTLRVWDIDDTKPAIGTLSNEAQTVTFDGVHSSKGHKTSISFLAFSKDGQLIASGSEDGLICLWDADNGTYICSFHEGNWTCAVLSLVFPHNPKLKFLVATYMDNIVRIWNTDSGDLMQLIGHSYWIRATAISPDNRLVASSSDDRTVRVWDISDLVDGKNEAGKVVETARVFESHEDYVFCVSFSPDGRYLASGGDDYNVLIWDLAHGDGKDKRTPDKRLYDDRLRQYVRVIAFMHDGKHLISSTASRTADIAIWNWQTETCLQILPRVEDEDDIQPFTSLQIDVQYPNVLITDFGSWPLDMDSLLKQQQQPTTLRRPLPPQWCPYDLSDDCSWITYENEKIVFLLKSYRPISGYQCRVRGRWVVIGSDSGKVMLFKFA